MNWLVKRIREMGIVRKADAFDWACLPAIDAEDVQLYVNSTDAANRKAPLAIALQVHDRLLREFTDGACDPMRMAELKGGMRAMKMFAKAMTANVMRVGAEP